MRINVRQGFCFGKSHALPANKNCLRRYIPVIIFACAMCCMTQTVIALPDTTIPETTPTVAAPTDAAPAATDQTAAPAATAQSKATQSGATQPATAPTDTTPATSTEAAQPGVASTATVPTETAPAVAAPTATVPTEMLPVAETPAAIPPSEAAPAVVAPATAIQTDAVQPGVAPIETVPTAATPAEEAPAATVQPEAAPVAVTPAATVPSEATPASTAPAAKVQSESARSEVVIDPALKKKIVFIQFDVANIGHVDDINNIYDGLPAALSSRMGSSDKFLSASSRYSIPKGDDASRHQAVTQIAGETGAQFLISGLVVDAGIEKGIRHIEVELNVYDGFTGVQVLSRRFEDQAEGDVKVGNNKSFGSSVFFNTEFGKAINRLIDSADKGIQGALEMEPFTAHIIRADGNKVLLDAGSNSLLKAGYKLVAYVNDAHNPIKGLVGAKLGDADSPADVITLLEVKPQFSIGQLSQDAALLGIKAGNVARINDADQHYLTEHPIEIHPLAKTKPVAKTERVKEKLIAKAQPSDGAKVAKPKAKHKTKVTRKISKEKTPAKAPEKPEVIKLEIMKKPQIDPCERLAALQAACGK